jgi:dienelactone hydrolase
LIVLLVSLGACAKSAELEAAEPLGAAARSVLEKIPGYGPGPYEAVLLENLVLKRDELGDMSLRVWYPHRDEPLPVVIFSHGNWSDKDRYDAVLKHWASYGFTVIATTHLDGVNMARGIFNALRYGNAGLIAGRVADVRYLIDHLAQVQALVPVTLNPERLAVTGHSFGAFTAQQFAGASAIVEGGDIVADDSRVDAVVALSPPGPMFDEITSKSWTSMHGPVFMTTGTHDVNPRFFPDWRLHKMSFDTAIVGEQYALVVAGADHYLGNLICRPEREAAPQIDALNIINALSTVFLLTQLTDDQALTAWLQAADVANLSNGFAILAKK